MGPGDLIAERYELIEAVGAGGMGIVYRARDLTDDAQVAVKLVPAMPRSAQRFKREAEVLSRLRHPGVVRYVDDGRAGRGQRFMVMEWLDGEDLEARLDRGRLSILDSVRLGRRVAEALGAVHELDVIHRDLKPANIFLVNREIDLVKVLDFGIAHVAAPIALTQTGMTLGTPSYMSPEQVERDPAIGPRADLFALGSVLFECLSGRPPFVGASAVQVMQQVLREPVPNLWEIRPDAPEPLAELLDRLLAKDPAARPADGRAVAAELRAIEEDLARAAPRRSAPLILTRDEQVFVAIIVSETPTRPAIPVTAGDRLIPVTRPHAAAGPGPSRAYGAIPTTLSHGVHALVLPQQGSARELAVRSARCALDVRARNPEGRVALVMGHARMRDIVPIGDVARRPTAVLRDASEGELRVDSVTAGLLPSRFVLYEGDGAHTLVREDPLDAPARLLAGRPTPFVGRVGELASVERALRDSLAGAARGALIIGEPGVGKSRLMHEVTARLRREPCGAMVWSARGDAMTGSAYGIVAQWLREGAGISPTHSPEQAMRALRSIVALHCAAEDVPSIAPFLAELCGLEAAGASEPLDAARVDPRLMRARVRSALLTFLEKLSRSRPLILAAEDLHGADRPSLELIEALAGEPGLPIAIVATAALDLDAEVASALVEAGFVRTDLGPLEPAAARAMVEERLRDVVSTEGIERILRRAHGNPYFLEELVRRVDERGDTEELPETVLGMVRARFEALPGPARRVLRAASVFGMRFHLEGVKALLGGDEDAAEGEAWLATLIDQRILGWEQGVEDEPIYLFRHEMYRAAAYAALTHEDRTLGHLLAGRWLADRDTTASFRLAAHFEKAEQPDLARAHHAQAAEDALQSFDFDRVREHAEAAIRTSKDDALRGRLRLLQARAEHLRGDQSKARVYAEMAIGALEDTPSMCRAARIITGALTAGGRADEAATLVRSILRRADPEGLTDRPLCDLVEMGFGLARGAHREVAEQLLERAERELGRQDGPMLASRAARAGLRGRLAMQDGDAGEWLEQTRLRRELQQRAGDIRGVCWSDATIGYVLLELGAFAEAEHVCRAAGALARELGFQNLVAVSDHNLGLVLCRLGRSEEGARRERDAIAQFDALSDRRLALWSRIYLSTILLADDAAEEAEEVAAAALDLAARHSPSLRALAAAALARARLACGDAAGALAVVEEAVPDLDGTLEAGEAELRLVWAESLRANGRDEDALDAIREANARVLERASRIRSRAYRASFLENVPESSRTIALYEAWTQ